MLHGVITVHDFSVLIFSVTFELDKVTSSVTNLRHRKLPTYLMTFYSYDVVLVSIVCGMLSASNFVSCVFCGLTNALSSHHRISCT